MAFLTTVSRILHSSPESLSEENLEFCKKGNVPKLRIACEQFSDKEKLVTLPRSIAQQWFRLFQEKAALLSMENLTNAVCHYCYPIESHDLVKWITVTCEDGKQISLPLIRLLPYERFRKVIDLTKLDQPHMFPQYSLFNFDVFGQYLKTPHSLSADVSTLERAVKLYDLADWIDDRKLKDLCIEQMKYLHDKEDCPETVKYLYKATREKMDAEDAVSAGKLTKAETHLSNALALRPTDSRTMLAYAKFDFDRNRFYQAHTCLEKASSQDPELITFQAKAILEHAKALSEEIETHVQDITKQKKKLLAKEESKDKTRKWLEKQMEKIGYSPHLGYVHGEICAFLIEKNDLPLLPKLDQLRDFLRSLSRKHQMQLLEKGLRLNKSSSKEEQFLEAEFLLELERWQEAKQVMDTLRNARLTAVEENKLSNWLRRISEKCNKKKINKALQKGIQLFKEEKWAEAKNHLESNQEDNTEWLFMWGYISLKLGLSIEKPYFQRALLFAEEDGLSIEGYLQISIYFLQKHDRGLAQKGVDFFLSLPTEQIFPLPESQKKEIAKLLRNFDEVAIVKAEEFFSEEETLKPRRMTLTRFQLITTLIEAAASRVHSFEQRKTKLAEARQKIQEAEDAIPISHRARLQNRIAELEKEIKTSETVLKEALKNAKNGKLTIEERNKQIKEAELFTSDPSWTRKIKKTKSRLLKIENLFFSIDQYFEKADLRQLAECKGALVSALQIYPEEVHFYSILGNVYLEEENFKEAKDSFERVYPYLTDQQKPSMAEKIAQIYVKLGELGRADQWFQKMLRFNENNQEPI